MGGVKESKVCPSVVMLRFRQWRLSITDTWCMKNCCFIWTGPLICRPVTIWPCLASSANPQPHCRPLTGANVQAREERGRPVPLSAVKHQSGQTHRQQITSYHFIKRCLSRLCSWLLKALEISRVNRNKKKLKETSKKLPTDARAKINSIHSSGC